MKATLAILLSLIAGMFGILAVSSHSNGWRQLLFAWTAVAFAIVAAGYAGLGTRVYMKQSDGRIRWPGFALLLPYHFMNWISLQLFCVIDRRAAIVEIVPNVYLGRRLTDFDLRSVKIPWRGVLDLTVECHESKGLRGVAEYRNVQVLDRTAPTVEQIRSSVAWIQDVRSRGPVLVHCAFGHGRSALVVIAFVAASGFAPDVEAARALVRSKRPGIRLNRDQVEALARFGRG